MSEITVRDAWVAKLELEKELEKTLRDFESKYSVNVNRVDVERYTFKPLVDSTSTIVRVVLGVSLKGEDNTFTPEVGQ